MAKDTGRPSKYIDEFAEQARKLCLLGATDVELADFFNVTVSTISNWKNHHPVFMDALKTGKGALDERVERSLFHRAIGYTFDAVKIFPPKGKDDGPTIVPYREHVPPDTVACIFWLKNRKSREWRDVRQHEIGAPGDFDSMSDADLIRAVESEAAELGVPVAETSH